MKLSFVLRSLLLALLLSVFFCLTIVFSRSGENEVLVASSRITSFEATLPNIGSKTETEVKIPPLLNITQKPTHYSIKDNSPQFSNPPPDENFPFVDEGTTWSDPFCRDFFSNQFSVKMVPCKNQADRVVCYGSPYDDKMGSCSINDLAMSTGKFYQTMFNNKDGVRNSQSLWLISNELLCPDPQFSLMEKKMVGGDYVKRLTQTAILTPPQGECDKWVHGTTFIFMGFDDHIYFKYLSWFSLHNGILNYEAETGNKPSLIIRIPELKGTFTHAGYEQKLFPEAKLMSLKNFSVENTGNVCFEKVVITPWAYSTNAFRCKMSDSARRLRNKCYSCKGTGLTGTRFVSFKKRALSACSIKEVTHQIEHKAITSIVLQVRKAYIRRLGDNLDKFSRVMENPNEVVNGLKEHFPNADVHVMVAEEMGLCDQLRLIHNADVLIGVHGAGLVHLWWLQDHALLFEMVPSRQRSNPSFKMLATITGRRYYGYEKLKGPEKRIIVDVPDIVAELKKHF